MKATPATPAVKAPAAAPPTSAAPAVQATGAPSGARRVAPSHRVGAPPRAPKPTLPDGAPVSEADEGGRRQVAGGTLTEDQRLPATDPELDALRNAERVLFPEPLQGISAGWRWEFETSTSSESVDASGMERFGRNAVPSATLEDATTAEWLQSLNMPNLPVRLDPRVVKYLKFYRDTKRGRGIAQSWARKSGRYTPAMMAELARLGLPTDLVWLSLIESGHNPTIMSPAGAAGLWQFMPASGRLYGLTVDRWVDERLDPRRATQAAGKYLRDLYQRFGSWELAMAAYNMGHGGMLRSIKKFNANDYWTLSRMESALPWETSLYVPKVFAIAIVMNNKRAFGLQDITPDPAISFDEVRVASGTTLQDVANASGSSVAALTSLNPHYLAGRTPPHISGQARRQWAVHVPAGEGHKTSGALASGNGAAEHRAYVVRFGESLDMIARSHATTTKRLTTINRLAPEERLVPGTVLLLPQGEPPVAAAAPTDVEDMIVVPSGRHHEPNRSRVFYRVMGDETTGEIARAFSVPTEDLLAWNELDPDAKLQREMTLQVFVAPDTDLSGVCYVRAKDARFVVVGSQQFHDYFEGKSGRKRVVVEAKEGDTLAKVGDRHGLSAGMMERINRYSRSKKLAKGERVVVYTKQHTESAPIKRKELEAPVPPRPDALPGNVDATAKRSSN